MAFQVLCVDDDPHVLTVLRWVLEAKGYSVTAAESGTAALAHLAEPFDAAVLDYDLPDINGALLAERLKLFQPDVPIILFSGCVNFPSGSLDNFVAVVSKAEVTRELLKILAGLINGKATS